MGVGVAVQTGGWGLFGQGAHEGPGSGAASPGQTALGGSRANPLSLCRNPAPLKCPEYLEEGDCIMIGGQIEDIGLSGQT